MVFQATVPFLPVVGRVGRGADAVVARAHRECHNSCIARKWKELVKKAKTGNINLKQLFSCAKVVLHNKIP
jgi:hypothetical protein